MCLCVFSLSTSRISLAGDSEGLFDFQSPVNNLLSKLTKVNHDYAEFISAPTEETKSHHRSFNYSIWDLHLCPVWMWTRPLRPTTPPPPHWLHPLPPNHTDVRPPAATTPPTASKGRGPTCGSSGYGWTCRMGTFIEASWYKSFFLFFHYSTAAKLQKSLSPELSATRCTYYPHGSSNDSHQNHIHGTQRTQVIISANQTVPLTPLFSSLSSLSSFRLRAMTRPPLWSAPP